MTSETTDDGEMIPRARIKTTMDGYRHAVDLMREINRGNVRLGVTPGSRHVETMDGHKFIACRLCCGGVDIREVPAHG